jgi:hypothetical protein
MTETTVIQPQVRLAASEAGYTLWRNNTGLAYTGREVVELSSGSVMIHDPRRIRFGLCKGGSDLIGFRPVVITEDMVGTTIAQFAAIEVKTPRKRPTADQQHFIDFVNQAGGHAFVARSAEDIEEQTR